MNLKSTDLPRFGTAALLALLALALPAAAEPWRVSSAAPAADVESDLRQESYERFLTVLAEHGAPGPQDLDAFVATASLTPQGFNCFPTCDEDDGRFLTIAGDNLITLSDGILEVEFSVPAGASSFQLGIFDGDGAEPTPAGPPDFEVSNWDLGVPTLFTYTLFADPLADGSSMTVVPLQAGFPTVDSTDMPNDEWCCSDISTSAPGDFTIPTSPAAQAPSGNYFYRLRIELTDPGADVLNAFKIRTSGVVTIETFEQPFSYIANFNATSDAFTVFPDLLPDLSNIPAAVATSTYDGTFSFFFDITGTTDTLTVWGGDFDRGKWDGTDLDTDDPDTPNAPFIPFFATADAVPESAVGIGAPPDDQNPAAAGGFGIFVIRPPSIRWDLMAPDGQDFPNENPSGNQEWEAFTISTTLPTTCPPSPFPFPSCADFAVSQIPLGTYEMSIQGVDMQNLNAILFPARALCVDVFGTPCEVLRPFLVGDTVFLDLNLNGVQDPGEPGIPGVILHLVDGDGNVVATTVTDGNGMYEFGVEAGTHTVVVAPENFGTPAPAGAVGDRVWLDQDGDGVQDAGEPGIANVKVRLFDAGGNGAPGGGDDVFLGATLTGQDGRYIFGDLPPGTYYTDVANATVPAGLALTGGSDPSATRTITSNEVFRDLDFGYGNASAATAIIGDFVWSDANNDGVQDPGESGIGGVTIDLTDPTGTVFIATTTTAADGSYYFTGVAPGSYRVDVTDTAGALTGYTLTVGPDSNPDPTAPIVVGLGDVYLAADFGYFNPALFSISDVVWFDADRDGVKDPGEPGIGGVSINLVGPSGEVVATTTDPDGNFTFPGLPNGSFELVITDVDLVLAGLLPTTSASAAGRLAVEIDGADVANVSFGWVDSGTLEGAFATTPTSITDTVVDQNVLTYDFGFFAPCEIGDDGDSDSESDSESDTDGDTDTDDDEDSGSDSDDSGSDSDSACVRSLGTDSDSESDSGSDSDSDSGFGADLPPICRLIVPECDADSDSASDSDTDTDHSGQKNSEEDDLGYRVARTVAVADRRGPQDLHGPPWASGPAFLS